MQSLKIYGQNLRKSRQNCGLSLWAFAEFLQEFGLCINASTLNRYENGLIRIPVDVYDLIVGVPQHPFWTAKRRELGQIILDQLVKRGGKTTEKQLRNKKFKLPGVSTEAQLNLLYWLVQEKRIVHADGVFEVQND